MSSPAVVVEVEERHAGPHRLRQVAIRRHRVLVDPGDAAGAAGNLLEERRACARDAQAPGTRADAAPRPAAARRRRNWRREGPARTTGGSWPRANCTGKRCRARLTLVPRASIRSCLVSGGRLPPHGGCSRAAASRRRLSSVAASSARSGAGSRHAHRRRTSRRRAPTCGVVPRAAAARHPAARRLARRVRPDVLHPREPAAADRPAAARQRRVALPPDLEQALPFYLSRAPERLPAPEAWPDPRESHRCKFVRQGLTMPEMPGTPAVSHVRLVDVDGDKQLDVLGTDMRQGVVFTGRAGKAGSALSVVASIPHPSHVTVHRSWTRTASRILLVADLGEFFPERSQQGRRDLAARPRRRQVQRVLAGRLAAHRQRRRPPTSTATARSISPSRRSAGARPARSPSREHDDQRRRSRRSPPTRSIRARAASTSSRSI